MNRWECLLLGLALGSLAMAFVMSWIDSSPREKTDEEWDQIVRDLRQARQPDEELSAEMAARIWANIEPNLPRKL